MRRIRFSDELPPPHIDVLLCVHGGRVIVIKHWTPRTFNPGIGAWYPGPCRAWDDDYWMPLPDPPEQP